MAQSGYTPIQLYYSTTAAAVPVNTNLSSGELAINITDGKLYYKNNSGVVTLLSASGGGPAGGSNTQVQYNSSGVLAGSANLTFNGTTLTANTLNLTNALGTGYGGTGLTSFTSGGVVYASSTSAFVTGSALTFSGSALGVNATSTDASFNLQALTANYASALSLIANNDNGAQYNNISSSTSGGTVHWRIGGVAGISQLPFSIAGTEGMRLTSTGLGIGTSSPSSKLHVATTTSETGVQLTNNNATVYLGAVYSANNFANGTVAGQAILRSGVGIAFSTTSGASVQATLDGSGNLGLGVTPSAWSSSFGIKAFDISGGAVYGSSSDVNMVWNGVYNTSNQWKYKTSATANLYTQDGAHKWFTAPSGTAGNAITFTQAMTLGSNGFLGIGQTSPAYPIDISTGANSAQIAFQSTISNGTNFKIAQGIQGVTNSGMQIYDLTNSAVRLAIDGSGNLLVGTTSTSNKVEIQQTATNAALWVQTGGTTSSYTIADFRTGTNASALAIYGDRTSIFNGNVGLDITPSAWISPTFQSQYAGFHGHYYGASNNQTLVTSNAYVSSDTNFRYMYSGPSLCLTSNNGAGWFWNYAGSGTGGNVISYTTLMTLNTSGTLLLGTTQGNPYSGFEIAPNSGASFQIIGHASGTGSGSAYMNFNYNQSGCGSITQNGTSAVLYNITSDYRLKEVIGSVTGSGERIDALQPIDYLMKADGSQHRGFLAHKFQEVYPNSVVGEKDAIDAQENPVYQQMQASTAEVIADLVAEIQSLRKRLADAGI